MRNPDRNRNRDDIEDEDDQEKKMRPATFVTDRNGAQVDSANVTVPTNRNFRAAWVLNGSVMEVDMAAARALFKERMALAKEKMMGSAANVEAFIESQLSGDPAVVAAYTAKFQMMVAAVPDAQIDAAATPEALSALWDANVAVLGANPFNPAPVDTIS